MTRLVTYAGALLAAVVLAATASAHPSTCSVHQTGKAELRCGVRAFHYGASGVRWLKNHRYLELPSKSADQVHNELLNRLWWERRGRHWIHQARRRLAVHQVAPAGFPPHHALWLCLHSVEAGSWYDHDSGGSGHYGGLQMGPDWLHEFVGTADQYSQAQQEWFAERAYASSHYSSSFIYGQWLEWEHGAGDKCVSLE